MSLWGNSTSLSTTQKIDYLTMLTAMVAIGYVGFVVVKEVRRGK